MANNKAISGKTMAAQKTIVKPKPKFDDGLFTAGVVGALKSNESISEDATIDDVNSAFNEIVELWLITKEYAEHGGFDTAIEAIQDITAYIVENAYIYTKPVLFRVYGFTVSLSVPTKVPGVQAVFSYQCTSLTTDISQAMLSAYADLQQFASDNFKPKVNPAQTQQSNQADKPEDEQFEFASLRMLLYNGKMQARLIPLEGRWTQFGVPLYPDEARKAGINLSDYVSPGDYELQGSAILQYKPDGKPMRSHSVELS